MDKKLIKEAVKEVWDERAVTYANGAVNFAIAGRSSEGTAR